MKTSQAGIDLIKHFESLHDGDLSQIGLQPKMCPAGIWTEGYGHAMIYNGKPLSGSKNKELAYKLHTVKDEIDAEKLLADDLIPREQEVSKAVVVQLTQHQFDALISFDYNLGIGNLKSSTLLKKVNANLIQDAANEFLKWNKCKGKVLKGLTLRREAERTLFLS